VFHLLCTLENVTASPPSGLSAYQLRYYIENFDGYCTFSVHERRYAVFTEAMPGLLSLSILLWYGFTPSPRFRLWCTHFRAWNQLWFEKKLRYSWFLSIGELWDVFLSWSQPRLLKLHYFLPTSSCHAVSETILLYSKIPSQEVFMKISRYVAHHVQSSVP
jgi:hypothetical protein